MSIKVTSRVWDHADQDGSSLLLLLALADHADDDGVAYPGIERLAYKARVSERQARRIIRDLEEKGELITELQQGRSGGRGNTNNYLIATGMSTHEIERVLVNRFEVASSLAHRIADYMINLQNGGNFEGETESGPDPRKELIGACQKRGTSRAKKGDIQGQKGGHPGPKRGTSRAKKGDIAMSPESSVEPSIKSSVEPSAAAATATLELTGDSHLIQEITNPLENTPANGHHQDPPSTPYPPANSPPPDDDPAFTQVCRLYQAEIGKMSPLIAGEIRDRLRRCPVGWFEQAISKAAAAEARRWNYIKSILAAWEKCGGPENDHRPGKATQNGDQQNGTYFSKRGLEANQESGSGRESLPEADGMPPEWRDKLQRLTFTFDPNTPDSG